VASTLRAGTEKINIDSDRAKLLGYPDTISSHCYDSCEEELSRTQTEYGLQIVGFGFWIWSTMMNENR
jgi:hypothetical protein